MLVADSVSRARRRKSAAERRAQRVRAHGRLCQHLIKSLDGINQHRGGKCSRLGEALLHLLRRPSVDAHAPPGVPHAGPADPDALPFDCTSSLPVHLAAQPGLDDTTEGVFGIAAAANLAANLATTHSCVADASEHLVAGLCCIRGCGPLRFNADMDGLCDICEACPVDVNTALCPSCDLWVCSACRVRLLHVDSSDCGSSQTVEADVLPEAVCEGLSGPVSGHGVHSHDDAGVFRQRVEDLRASPDASDKLVRSAIADMILDQFAERLDAAGVYRRENLSWDSLNARGFSQGSREMGLYHQCCERFHGGSRDPRAKTDDFLDLWDVMKQI